MAESETKFLYHYSCGLGSGALYLRLAAYPELGTSTYYYWKMVDQSTETQAPMAGLASNLPRAF